MPYVKVSVVMRTFILTGRGEKGKRGRDNKVWKKSSSVFEGIIYLNLQIEPRKTPTSAEASVPLVAVVFFSSNIQGFFFHRRLVRAQCLHL